MKREDLDRELKAIDTERKALEDKISTLRKKKVELQQQYVSEYSNKIKVGSKIRIKVRWGGSEKEHIVFIGSYIFKGTQIDSYDYSCLYEDKSIGAKLLKVKKDGTPSERVERIWGDIVEIEILEQ